MSKKEEKFAGLFIGLILAFLLVSMPGLIADSGGFYGRGRATVDLPAAGSVYPKTTTSVNLTIGHNATPTFNGYLAWTLNQPFESGARTTLNAGSAPASISLTGLTNNAIHRIYLGWVSSDASSLLDADITSSNFVIEGDADVSTMKIYTSGYDTAGHTEVGKSIYIGSTSNASVVWNTANYLGPTLFLGGKKNLNSTLTINSGVVGIAGDTWLGKESNSTGSMTILGGSITLATLNRGLGIGTLLINGGATEIGIINPLSSLVMSSGSLTVSTINTHFQILGGSVSPSLNTSQIWITGNYTQGAGATLSIQLTPISGSVLAQSLSVLSNMNLAGGLSVTTRNTLVPTRSVTLNVLSWGGTVTGSFDRIQLPNFGSSVVWSTANLYTQGVLNLSVAEVDSDGDGLLDSEDEYPYDASRGSHIHINYPLNNMFIENTATSLNVIVTGSIRPGYLGSLVISTGDITISSQRVTLPLQSRVTQSILITANAAYRLTIGVVSSNGFLDPLIATRSILFGVGYQTPSTDILIEGADYVTQSSSLDTSQSIWVAHLSPLSYTIPSSSVVSINTLNLGYRKFMPTTLNIQGTLNGYLMYNGFIGTSKVFQSGGSVEFFQIGLGGNEGEGHYYLSGGSLKLNVLYIEDTDTRSQFRMTGGLLDLGILGMPSQNAFTLEGGTLNVRSVTFINGSLIQAPTASIQITLTNYPSALRAESMTLNGRLVIITDNNTALSLNSTFQLFTVSGSKVISFNSMQLPAVPTGMMWTTQNLASLGQLSLVALDTDGDGVPDEDDPFHLDATRSTANILLIDPDYFLLPLSPNVTFITPYVSANVAPSFTGYLAWSSGNFSVTANRVTENVYRPTSNLRAGFTMYHVPIAQGQTMTLTMGLVNQYGALMPGVATFSLTASVALLDTDGDGVRDEDDPYPLDATRSTANIVLIDPDYFLRPFNPNVTFISPYVSANVAPSFNGYLAWSSGNFSITANRVTENIYRPTSDLRAGFVMYHVPIEEGQTMTLTMGLVNTYGALIPSVATISLTQSVVSRHVTILAPTQNYEPTTSISSVTVSVENALPYQYPWNIAITTRNITDVSGWITQSITSTLNTWVLPITDNHVYDISVVMVSANQIAPSIDVKQARIGSFLTLKSNDLQWIIEGPGTVTATSLSLPTWAARIGNLYDINHVISNGVTWNLNSVWLAPREEVTATLNISGGTINISADIKVGALGKGVVVQSGGDVSINAIAINEKGIWNLSGGRLKTNYMDFYGGATGTFNATGGTLEVGTLSLYGGSGFNLASATLDIKRTSFVFGDLTVPTASKIILYLTSATQNTQLLASRVTVNGTLQVLKNGPYSLSQDTKFNVFFENNRNISIKPSQLQLPTLNEVLTWNIEELETSGNLQIININGDGDRDGDGVIDKNDAYPTDNTRSTGNIRILFPLTQTYYIQSVTNNEIMVANSEMITVNESISSINFIFKTVLPSGYTGKLAISTGDITVSENRMILNLASSITQSISVSRNSVYKVTVAAISANNQVDTSIATQSIIFGIGRPRYPEALVIEGTRVTQSVSIVTTRDIVIGNLEDIDYTLPEGVTINGYVISTGWLANSRSTLNIEGGVSGAIMIMGEGGYSHANQSKGLINAYWLAVGKYGSYRFLGGKIALNTLEFRDSIQPEPFRMLGGLLETSRIYMPSTNTFVIESGTLSGRWQYTSTQSAVYTFIEGSLLQEPSGNLELFLSSEWEGHGILRAESITLNGHLNILTANTETLQMNKTYQIFSVSKNISLNLRSLTLPTIPAQWYWATSNLGIDGTLTLVSDDDDLDGTRNQWDAYPTDSARSTANISLQDPSFYLQPLNPGISSIVIYAIGTVAPSFNGWIAWATQNFNVTANRVTVNAYISTADLRSLFGYYGVPIAEGTTINITNGLVDQFGALLPGVATFSLTQHVPSRHIDIVLPTNNTDYKVERATITVNIQNLLPYDYFPFGEIPTKDIVLSVGDITSANSWMRQPIISTLNTWQLPVSNNRVYTIKAAIVSGNIIDPLIQIKEVKIGTFVDWHVGESEYIIEGPGVTSLNTSLDIPTKQVRIGNLENATYEIYNDGILQSAGIQIAPRTGVISTLDVKAGNVIVSGQIQVAGSSNMQVSGGLVSTNALTIIYNYQTQSTGSLKLSGGRLRSHYLTFYGSPQNHFGTFVGEGGVLEVRGIDYVGFGEFNSGRSTLDVKDNLFIFNGGLVIPTGGAIEISLDNNVSENIGQVFASGITINGKIQVTTQLVLDEPRTFTLFQTNAGLSVASASVTLPSLPSYLTWNTQALIPSGQIQIVYNDADNDGVVDILDAFPEDAARSTPDIWLRNRESLLSGFGPLTTTVNLSVGVTLNIAYNGFLAWTKGNFSRPQERVTLDADLSPPLPGTQRVVTVSIPVSEGRTYRIEVGLVNRNGSLVTGSRTIVVPTLSVSLVVDGDLDGDGILNYLDPYPYDRDLSSRPSRNSETQTRVSTENLGLWIDASGVHGANAVTLNTKLKTILDQSGNQNDIRQDESMNQPYLVESARLRIKKALRSDGSAILKVPESALSTMTAFELYAVVAKENREGKDIIFSANDDEVQIGIENTQFFIEEKGVKSLIGKAYPNVVYLVNVTQEIQSGQATVRVQISGGNRITRRYTVGGSNPVNSLYILGFPSSGSGFRGDLGEFRLYKQLLNKASRLQVENELAKKWRIYLHRQNW